MTAAIIVLVYMLIGTIIVMSYLHPLIRDIKLEDEGNKYHDIHVIAVTIIHLALSICVGLIWPVLLTIWICLVVKRLYQNKKNKYFK